MPDERSSTRGRWTQPAIGGIGLAMTFAQILIEIIGWAGAVMILAAYVMLSNGRMTGQSRVYQWMNVVGAACFVVNSGYKHAWPSAVLNVIWSGIGLYTLWQVGRGVAARGERDNA